MSKDEKLEDSVNKSELIAKIVSKFDTLDDQLIEKSVKSLLNLMAETLAEGQRIEVRGFGSFSLHHREPRVGRNPKTGESVSIEAKAVPHFKPGKALKEAVQDSVTSNK